MQHKKYSGSGVPYPREIKQAPHHILIIFEIICHDTDVHLMGT